MQSEEPLGRHPAGGFVSPLPEPLNSSRPKQKRLGAADFAPMSTLKVFPFGAPFIDDGQHYWQQAAARKAGRR